MKRRVAVLGATGIVGQRFAYMLLKHPWFDLALLVGSERSAGRNYRESTRWVLEKPMPDELADRELAPLDVDLVVKESVDVAFVALPAEIALRVEVELAKVDDAGRVLKYGRESNPTVRYFERLMAAAERGEDAIAFSSGMTAITGTLLALMDPGSKVVAPYEVYSATIRFLEILREKAGLRYELVWPSAEALVEAASGGRSVVLLEVLTNPTVKVIDLEKLVSEIDERAVVVVDNTFTTPVMLKPLRYGVAAVVHSVTKYIAGHNDVVGGVAITSRELASELWEYRRVLGTIMSPFEAYLATRGLKTLHVRFERSCESARAVAEFLEDHPRVEEVYYPGLRSSPYHELARRLFGGRYYGGVLSFRVRGSYQDAVAFLLKLRVIRRMPSLGATESLAVLPYRSASVFIPEEARRRLGITENLVRLSVGLESAEDLIEDLAQALG